MQLHWLDVAIFLGFFAVVIGVSLFKSRKDETSEDYFLAGRNLSWWLIGFSIVAANISSEQFVGMAGQGAGSVGLAVSAYQLLGSVSIVIVAFTFLPAFLRAGIYTMPEYLEYRYNSLARSIMAVLTVIIYVTVTTTTVLYAGALTLKTIVGVELVYAVWFIGAVAAVYTTWGGLQAVAWADLFQGSTLLIGGLLTLVLGFVAIGSVSGFFEHNADRLHMVLPASHPILPWTTFIGGLWIPNLYYCGLNQFIVQRTLAARSLRHGQLGIIFAAAMWLLIPFAIVMPGIMARQLYGQELADPDQAYPMLIRHLIPLGLRGFIFAALAGAIISTLASVLNSAATIFTMDVYRRHVHPSASQRSLVGLGRLLTLVFVVLACVLAPYVGEFKGLFNFIQEFQGYISPGILAAFLWGFVLKRAPASAGVTALLLNPVVYGFLHWQHAGSIAFLNRMLISFVVVSVVMFAITAVRPLNEPRTMPQRHDIETRTAPGVYLAGAAVIAGVAAFFIIFW